MEGKSDNSILSWGISQLAKRMKKYRHWLSRAVVTAPHLPEFKKCFDNTQTYGPIFGWSLLCGARSRTQ